MAAGDDLMRITYAAADRQTAQKGMLTPSWRDYLPRLFARH